MWSLQLRTLHACVFTVDLRNTHTHSQLLVIDGSLYLGVGNISIRSNSSIRVIDPERMQTAGQPCVFNKKILCVSVCSPSIITGKSRPGRRGQEEEKNEWLQRGRVNKRALLQAKKKKKRRRMGEEREEKLCGSVSFLCLAVHYLNRTSWTTHTHNTEPSHKLTLSYQIELFGYLATQMFLHKW